MSNFAAATAADFNREIASSVPVVVDFWAPWCGPCKMMDPIVDKATQDLGGRARFLKVNTDENPGIAAEHGVSGIPCLIVFKDGKALDRLVGYHAEAAVLAMLARNGIA